MSKYDFLIVGAGLFGSVIAHELSKRGKKCLVIDKKNHIAGQIYTEEIKGITIHKYGPHIFHTNNKYIWNYVNKITKFNHYINTPLAIYKEKLYNLPFNMNTFYSMWGVKTPKEAKKIINDQIENSGIKNPKNLEEQAIKLVGHEIYGKLIKGYTEKQWGKKAIELPPFIIKRIPVRFTYDNNYFNDLYQGIPINGYTSMIEKLLENIETKLNINFFDNRSFLEKISNYIIYSGMIDEYFNYKYGYLEYRSLHFEHITLEENSYQGNAVVNFTEYQIPYTRIIEHKHFKENIQHSNTVITKEYPYQWGKGKEPYYPVNNYKNNLLFKKYKELSKKEQKTLFGGRLGDYKYYNMDIVIENALKTVNTLINI